MKRDKLAPNAAAVAGRTSSQSDATAAAASPESSEQSVFEQFAGYRHLKRRFEEVERRNISLPFFLPHDGINGNVLRWKGADLINFAGYNYIGLSGHPEVSRAAKAAIDRYGTSASASRIVSGQIPLHEELEKKIADFLGTEDCIVFVSGYGTNVSTISHLFARNDLVVHDNLAHNSIVTGCKLSEARRISFPHNDWDSLDRLLESDRDNYRNALIAIEAVYSMEGDIADIRRAVDLRKRHNTLLMVDEAHSLGTIGRSGRGIAEYFGVDRSEADIWMGTLSKSFASCGGYIAGETALVQYLRYSAPGFIFSVGLSPPDTAAALAALNVLDKEPGRVEELRQKSRFFRDVAEQQGWDIGLAHDTPIVPLIIGDAHKCMRLCQQLVKNGIHVQPIIYPAVSMTGARLRFFITINHTEEQIRHTVSTVARELEKLKDEGDVTS